MKLILNLFWLVLAIPCLLTAQTVSGTIVEQTGQPLTTTLSLYPLSYRFPVTEPLAVSSNRSDFTLKAPITGIYYLELKMNGHVSHEMPIFLDQGTTTPLRIRFDPVKKQLDLSSSRWQRWLELHREHRNRYKRWNQGQNQVDWAPDLQKIGKQMDEEKDPLTRSYLAALYMDLQPLGADLEQRRMRPMATLLPPESPFWAINPRSCPDMVNNQGGNEAILDYLQRMSDKNPDYETRAFALLYRISMASSEYEVGTWKTLYQQFLQKYGKSRYLESVTKKYDPGQVLETGSAFPRFEIKGLDGSILSNDTFKGKVLLVDFWATWCPPCLKEIPIMEDLYQKYRDQGFEILSLAIDDQAESIARFRQKRAMPWAHAILDKGRSHALPFALFVSSIPRAFLIGRDGRLLECKRALLRGESLIKVVEKSLK